MVSIAKSTTNLVGYVIGTRVAKTLKVRVPHAIYNEKYKRTFIKHKNYLVHDETESCFVGDVVKITKTEPFAKSKDHIVSQMIKRADRYVDPLTKFIYTNGHLNIPVGYVDESGKQINKVPNHLYKEMGVI